MVTLRGIIVARIWLGVGGIERVSMSSRTLTKLLMVLGTLSTFTGRAWNRVSFIVTSLEVYIVATVAIAEESIRKPHFSLGDGGGALVAVAF